MRAEFLGCAREGRRQERGERARRRVLATALALSAVLTVAPRPGRADDNRECLLARPAGQSVEFYVPRSRPGQPVRCPLKQHSDKKAGMLVGTPNAPLVHCGTRTLCGRPWAVVREGSEEFLADPADVQIAEDPVERSDVPDIRVAPPVPPCLLAYTSDQWADSYRVGEATGPSSPVDDIRRMEPGTPVYACERYGPLALIQSRDFTGLMEPSQLRTWRRYLPAESAREGGQACMEFSWTGKVLAPKRLYVVGADRPTFLSQPVVEEGADVEVKGAYAGSAGKAAWYLVGHNGELALISATHVQVAGSYLAILPSAPIRSCPATAGVAEIRCPATAAVETRLGSLPGGPPPRTVDLQAGARVPVLAAGEADLTLWYLGLRVKVPRGACVAETADSIALSVAAYPPVSDPGISDTGAKDDLAAVPDAFSDDWREAMSDEGQTVSSLVWENHFPPEQLARVQPYRFPFPTATAADIAGLLAPPHASGPSDMPRETRQLLRRAILGSQSPKSPLAAEVYGALAPTTPAPAGECASKTGCFQAACVLARGNPAAAPQPAAGDPASALRLIAVESGDPSDRIAAAEMLARAGLFRAARRLFLDALATEGTAESILVRALTGYEQAVSVTAPDPSAGSILGPLCLRKPEAARDDFRTDPAEAGSGLEWSPMPVDSLLSDPIIGRLCRLAAAAAMEGSDAAPARAYVDRMRQLSRPDARQFSLVAVHLAREGKPFEAAVQTARALAAARDECGAGTVLWERTALQLVRAAYGAGEPELARAVMARLRDETVADELPLAVHVLLSSGDMDSTLAVLERHRYGLARGLRDGPTLLWAGRALEEACSLDAAKRVSSTVEAGVAELHAAADRLAALPKDSLGLRDLLGVWRRLLAAESGSVRHALRGVAGDWRDGPCGEWLGLERELSTIEGVTAWPPQWQTQTLMDRLGAAANSADATCRVWLGGAEASLRSEAAALTEAVDSLKVDIQEHVETESIESTALTELLRTFVQNAMDRDVREFQLRCQANWPLFVRLAPMAEEPSSGVRDEVLRSARAAGESPPESPTFTVCVPPAADPRRQGSFRLQLDEKVEAALRCVESATPAWNRRDRALRGYEDRDLVRYLPVLRLVRPHNLLPELMRSLPPRLAEELAGWARSNARGSQTSCCLSAHPGVADLRRELDAAKAEDSRASRGRCDRESP